MGMRAEEFLAGWFADPGAHPFVILNDGARAGFALVARPPAFPRTSIAFRMAEFFVVEPSRRRGVGANAAALLFSRFAGDWEVLEDAHNRPALQFWRRVICARDGWPVLRDAQRRRSPAPVLHRSPPLGEWEVTRASEQ